MLNGFGIGFTFGNRRKNNFQRRQLCFVWQVRRLRVKCLTCSVLCRDGLSRVDLGKWIWYSKSSLEKFRERGKKQAKDIHSERLKIWRGFICLSMRELGLSRDMHFTNSPSSKESSYTCAKMNSPRGSIT